jgi:hypothetical protein
LCLEKCENADYDWRQIINYLFGSKRSVILLAPMYEGLIQPGEPLNYPCRCLIVSFTIPTMTPTPMNTIKEIPIALMTPGQTQNPVSYGEPRIQDNQDPLIKWLSSLFASVRPPQEALVEGPAVLSIPTPAQKGLQCSVVQWISFLIWEYAKDRKIATGIYATASLACRMHYGQVMESLGLQMHDIRLTSCWFDVPDTGDMIEPRAKTSCRIRFGVAMNQSSRD